jgi:hypothetical protein
MATLHNTTKYFSLLNTNTDTNVSKMYLLAYLDKQNNFHERILAYSDKHSLLIRMYDYDQIWRNMQFSSIFMATCM